MTVSGDGIIHLVVGVLSGGVALYIAIRNQKTPREPNEVVPVSKRKKK